jgi:hypothetical protein
VNEEQIQLLEATAKEYRELAESNWRNRWPPLRTITMNNRHAPEVALEVAAVLDKLLARSEMDQATFSTTEMRLGL